MKGVDNMNKSMVLKNNLLEVLKNKGISQKELAEGINEREATISEFIRLKRTTINIDLLLKLATYLNIKDLGDLIYLEEAFDIGDIKQNKVYTSPISSKVLYTYLQENNQEKIQVSELLTEGIIVVSEFTLDGQSRKDIDNLFNSLDIIANNATDNMFIIKLIEVCRYKGDIIETYRYKTYEEALDAFELLFE